MPRRRVHATPARSIAAFVLTAVAFSACSQSTPEVDAASGSNDAGAPASPSGSAFEPDDPTSDEGSVAKTDPNGASQEGASQEGAAPSAFNDSAGTGAAPGPSNTEEGSGPAGTSTSTTDTSTSVAQGPPIKIGVAYDIGVAEAFSAFGAQGAEETGDIDQQVARLVEDVNAQGGLGGRPVEAVIFTSNPLEGDWESKAQQMCAKYTEDEPVAFVVSTVRMPTRSVIDCLSAANTPLVWKYSYLLEDAIFAQYPDTLYTPGHITAERMDFFVDSIATQGYFDGEPVVGLLRYDTMPAERFRDTVVVPGLERLGLELREDFGFTPPPSASAAGDMAAQINSAILRFRSAGVTHLLFAPTSGQAQFLFGPAAESQGYRPRYGMTSGDGLNFIVGNVPPEQLEGAMAAGWSPLSDVQASDWPPLNSAQERCFEVLRGTGGDAPRLCDGLYFMQDAFRGRTVDVLDTPAIRAAVDALGERFTPVSAFRTRFAADRHIGPSVARPVLFHEECECFRYVGDFLNIR